uniref:Uncharacterized protein n=1 Tax=Oryza nivara TaxID=4536 RepID=A0A0E0FJM9_ORYNI
MAVTAVMPPLGKSEYLVIHEKLTRASERWLRGASLEHREAAAGPNLGSWGVLFRPIGPEFATIRVARRRRLAPSVHRIKNVARDADVAASRGVWEWRPS